jgi:DeoR/GlpR family transcriptional regulator of sugar metabolism
MKQNYIPADRQTRIQNLIQEKGVVKVIELSRMFHVTELTIRRDLDVLEKQGVLDRTPLYGKGPDPPAGKTSHRPEGQ